MAGVTYECLANPDEMLELHVTQCVLVSASKEGISSSNLIILTLSEGHKGIMEVKHCVPLVV